MLCCSVAKSCPALWILHVDPSVLSQINYLHELITTDCCFFPFTPSLSHLPPSLSTSSFAPPFSPIFQGHCYYYTKLDQVTIALCCLTASSLFPAHPTVAVLVTQSCPTLCDPMGCSPPGSSVHGIFQARLLEWIAFPFPGDLPDPGIKPGSPALQEDFFFFSPSEPPGKPTHSIIHPPIELFS